MTDTTIRTYEGLFLLHQNAASDLGAATEHVRNIITRHQGEILVLRKWDERKLAYTIRGQKRGTYLISYFKAPTKVLSAIERDCNLSESILRAMVLKADHVGETEIELAKKENTLPLEVKLRSAEPATAAVEGAVDALDMSDDEA